MLIEYDFLVIKKSNKQNDTIHDVELFDLLIFDMYRVYRKYEVTSSLRDDGYMCSEQGSKFQYD